MLFGWARSHTHTHSFPLPFFPNRFSFESIIFIEVKWFNDKSVKRVISCFRLAFCAELIPYNERQHTQKKKMNAIPFVFPRLRFCFTNTIVLRVLGFFQQNLLGRKCVAGLLILNAQPLFIPEHFYLLYHICLLSTGQINSKHSFNEEFKLKVKICCFFCFFFVFISSMRASCTPSRSGLMR